MDLRFSAEEIAFRDELRTFFRTEVPAAIRSKVMEGRHLDKEDLVTAHKILHAKGWPCRIGRRSGAAPTGRRCSTTSTSRSCSTTACRSRCPSTSRCAGR